MDSLACKQKVVEIAKKLYERQMVNTNEGNVSILEAGKVYITPSQVCKEILEPDMIVVTDPGGKQLEGDLKPSSELPLHLHIYELRTDVHGIVHSHSPFATAYAVARKPIASKGYTEMIYLYDKIPVVSYGTPGSSDIYEGVRAYIYQTDTFLLANHGPVAVGSDLTDAYLKAEAVEAIAKTLFLARMLGGECALPHSDLEKLYRMRRENLGKGPITP